VKVLPFSIPKPENSTLLLQEDREDNFFSQLHQHEEIQISCILKGEGTYYIGDSFGQFKEGDIFAIGQHLPHVFSNQVSDQGVHMISLFFTPEAYGAGFFDHPEFIEFRNLFEIVKLGCRLGSNSEQSKQLMSDMRNQSALNRFLSFIELLQIFSRSRLIPISSFVNKRRFGEEEGNRMRKIMDYTFAHYDSKLSVSQAAEIASMTPNAFCRYFKQCTNKTYINFVLEIRIGQACRLLKQRKDLQISEIAFRCGFNNLTNFNRKFKQFNKRTPSEFRNG
jgi:AraC-like DNA-binding protein